MISRRYGVEKGITGKVNENPDTIKTWKWKTSEFKKMGRSMFIGELRWKMHVNDRRLIYTQIYHISLPIYTVYTFLISSAEDSCKI